MPSVDRYRFFPRCALHGILYWTCPLCGGKKESRMHPLLWNVSCAAGPKSVITHNRVFFIPQINLVPMPYGQRQRPVDYLVPEQQQLLDAYPQGELVLDRYRMGWPVHKLVRHQMEIELEAVEKFIARIEGGIVIADTRVYEELHRMQAMVSYWRDTSAHGDPPKGLKDKLREMGVDVPVQKEERRLKK